MLLKLACLPARAKRGMAIRAKNKIDRQTKLTLWKSEQNDSHFVWISNGFGQNGAPLENQTPLETQQRALEVKMLSVFQPPLYFYLWSTGLETNF